MTLEYPLYKKLKDAGFPQPEDGTFIGEDGLLDADHYGHALPYAPTLSELIDACGVEDGDNFELWYPDAWQANITRNEGRIKSDWFDTPEQAVAHLYLALNSNA